MSNKLNQHQSDHKSKPLNANNHQIESTANLSLKKSTSSTRLSPKCDQQHKIAIKLDNNGLNDKVMHNSIDDDETTQELSDDQTNEDSQNEQQISSSKRSNNQFNHSNEHSTTQLIEESNDQLTINQQTPNYKQESKQESKPDNKVNSKPQDEKDSPAFRLRTRRSTPRTHFDSSPYVTSTTSRKSYSSNSSDRLAKMARFRTNLNDVKRNLFDSEGQQQVTKQNRRTQSPSRSLIEDVDLNVFAENIQVNQLKEGRNNLNYLSLRIIEVLDEEEHCVSSSSSEAVPNNSMNDISSTNHHQIIKHRLLKIYCQQAEMKACLNLQKPVILLYLFNEYVNFKNRLTANKLIEIVKFDIKPLQTNQSMMYNSSVQIYPLYIELRAHRPDWISLISLKKKFEPTNQLSLNVINTQNKYQAHENIEDQPPTKNPRVIFSSYVVKPEPTTNEVQNNHNNLQNTKSPTIKRFKTINKSSYNANLDDDFCHLASIV